MAHHVLKTWPQFYRAVEVGEKTFEVRYNDRNFKVGDTLELREFDPEIKLGVYSGRHLTKRVTYVLPGGGFGLVLGYVVMGLGPEEA